MSYKGNYKPGEIAWPTTDFTNDKGFTVQADRADADINTIIARYNKTGQLPPTRNGEPFYGDVSDLGDLAESLIKIQEADELFRNFPARIREKFDNDKVKFVDFLSDLDNKEEAIELGLIQKEPVPEPTPPTGPAQ